MRKILTAAIFLLCSSQTVVAEDRADLEGTRIIGSRELPKVLVIVPWKPPLPGDLAGRPITGLLDEAFAPVDREVFRRQVDYHEGSLNRKTGDSK